MKLTAILFLLVGFFLSACQQQLSDQHEELPPSQLKFLNKLKNAEDSIKLMGNDSQQRAKIISTIDNYVVDSVRQFKKWHFKVENVQSVALDGVPSYSVDLSSPDPGDTSSQKINFLFFIPMNPKEQDLIEIKEVVSRLALGDAVELDGVIFMTDPKMEIVTLTDYFDSSKPKKLILIPIKVNQLTK